MKGQLIFEFVAASMIFFAVLFYTISLLNSSVGTFSGDSFKDMMNEKVISVSEYMLHSEGNWSSNPPDIGLAKKWPVLSYKKINKLGIYCNNSYGDLINNLGLFDRYYAIGKKAYKIKIEIYENGKNILDCGPTKISKGYFEITRFAISENNNILRVVLRIW